MQRTTNSSRRRDTSSSKERSTRFGSQSRQTSQGFNQKATGQRGATVKSARPHDIPRPQSNIHSQGSFTQAVHHQPLQQQQISSLTQSSGIQDLQKQGSDTFSPWDDGAKQDESEVYNFSISTFQGILGQNTDTFEILQNRNFETLMEYTQEQPMQLSPEKISLPHPQIDEVEEIKAEQEEEKKI